MAIMEHPLIYVIYNRYTKKFREVESFYALMTLNYFTEEVTQKYYKEGDY